jgi:hypothetical protein
MIRHEKLLTDRSSPGDAGSNEPDCATLRANLDKFGNNMWRRPAHYAGAIVAGRSTRFAVLEAKIRSAENSSRP